VEIIEQNPDSPSPTKFKFSYKVLSKGNRKSRELKNLVKERIGFKYNYVILEGDLVAHITVYRNDIKNLNKVDVDNLAKSCLDALKGIVFEDDNQVKLLIISKHYSKTNKVYCVIEKYLENKYKKINQLYNNRFKNFKMSVEGKEKEIEV
jgi:Holliday junction resolvase RusA-like endonuclease